MRELHKKKWDGDKDFADTLNKLRPQFHALLDNLPITCCLFKEMERLITIDGVTDGVGIIPGYAVYKLSSIVNGR